MQEYPKMWWSSRIQAWELCNARRFKNRRTTPWISGHHMKRLLLKPWFLDELSAMTYKWRHADPKKSDFQSSKRVISVVQTFASFFLLWKFSLSTGNFCQTCQSKPAKTCSSKNPIKIALGRVPPNVWNSLQRIEPDIAWTQFERIQTQRKWTQCIGTTLWMLTKMQKFWTFVFIFFLSMHIA